MSCPTCGKTMHMMGCRVTGDPLHWCPTCGTIKGCDIEPHAPALVSYARKFEKVLGGTEHLDPTPSELRMAWHRLGVAESINVSADRPAVILTIGDKP